MTPCDTDEFRDLMSILTSLAGIFKLAGLPVLFTSRKGHHTDNRISVVVTLEVRTYDKS